MPDDFLIFGSPLVEEPEIEEVVDSLRSGWIGTGPKVKTFEKMFREYKRSKYSVALNSCTAALHIALVILDLKKEDEVLLPAMTFGATANSVIHAGATPVFVDCEKDSMLIDLKDVERKITPNTKAIIPVHFAGRPCDMDKIMDIARKHKLKVIEDCAHAIETEYRGKKAGTIGDFGCFSFYVTKNIITGEGGMLITDNKEYAEKADMMSLHGLTSDAWSRYKTHEYKHYHIEYPGFKYNMMDLQAAIGIKQLPRIGRYWEKRGRIWARYNNAFKDLPVFIPAPVDNTSMKHAYHLYTLLLDIDNLALTRDEFLREMVKRKIGVGVHYIPLNLHPYYQRTFGHAEGDFPNSEWIAARTVSLPISPKLTDVDVDLVIKNVKEILEEDAG